MVLETRGNVSEPLVEVTRGRLVDAIHRGTLALVSADGATEASVGDPVRKIAYWRSSAKPFQALALVSSGAAARWNLGPEDLALIAGSHNGEPVHVERAASLLDRIGCTVDDLVCGTHPPLDASAARALERAGTSPSRLHHNCSGKHIGMLALAEHLGASRSRYEVPGHPVQREIVEHVARFTGLAPGQITIGVDGCGVPCIGTSVYHLALAFARLMAPDRSIPEPHANGARAIREAMTAHPYLVAGRTRLDTDLMRVGAGALVSKGGAGGVLGIGLRDGIGFAVKIEDGADAPAVGGPAGFVAIHALRQLGFLGNAALAELDTYARPRVDTQRGTLSSEPACEVRAVFSLPARPEKDGADG